MYISVDATCHISADDVVVSMIAHWLVRWNSFPLFQQIEAAAYSKVDGTYNPFVKPDPIHICKVHEHEDPLVQYLHEEILKFGNVTKVKHRRKLSSDTKTKRDFPGLPIDQRRILLHPRLHHWWVQIPHAAAGRRVPLGRKCFGRWRWNLEARLLERAVFQNCQGLRQRLWPRTNDES